MKRTELGVHLLGRLHTRRFRFEKAHYFSEPNYSFSEIQIWRQVARRSYEYFFEHPITILQHQIDFPGIQTNFFAFFGGDQEKISWIHV